MNRTKTILTFLMLLMLSSLRAQIFLYDFTSGYEGWSGDFSDYPVGDSIGYELEFTRATLPTPLNTSKFALKISGNNHSDDLFMFIKRKFSGLQPNTAYIIEVDVEFASEAPTNAVGIGGAPGEGVTMKAGATIIEPKKTEDGGAYVMNIDKGQQVNPGTDMDTIGHVGVTDTTTVFTLITRTNATHPFTITTDSNGEAWVCIGTDSGFEGTTTLYYNQITLTFNATTATREIDIRNDIVLYPNPVSDIMNLRVNGDLVSSTYQIMDASGHIALTGTIQSQNHTIDVSAWAAGIYSFIFHNGHSQRFTIVRD